MQIEQLADVLNRLRRRRKRIGQLHVSIRAAIAPSSSGAAWRKARAESGQPRDSSSPKMPAGFAAPFNCFLTCSENQPHRADVAKMLVHRRARRNGLGTALMRAIEATARECGRSLLKSLTPSPKATPPDCMPVWGGIRVGDIPDYATLYPDGRLRSTMQCSIGKIEISRRINNARRTKRSPNQRDRSDGVCAKRISLDPWRSKHIRLPINDRKNGVPESQAATA